MSTLVLDFLRGIAAVYVLINHTRGNFFMGGGRVVTEAGGTLGVYDYASLALLQATALGTEFVIVFSALVGSRWLIRSKEHDHPLSFTFAAQSGSGRRTCWLSH